MGGSSRSLLLYAQRSTGPAELNVIARIVTPSAVGYTVKKSMPVVTSIQPNANAAAPIAAITAKPPNTCRQGGR